MRCLAAALTTALVIVIANDDRADARWQPKSSGASAPRWVTFENIAATAGVTFANINGASPDKYLVETMGSGGLFFDYDNDGWIDLFLVDGGSIADTTVNARARHRLLSQCGQRHLQGCDGRRRASRTATTAWVHVPAISTTTGESICTSRTMGRTCCIEISGKGAFTDVTRAAGVGLSGWSTSCAFLDVDVDGDLDLFVTNYLDAHEGEQPLLR